MVQAFLTAVSVIPVSRAAEARLGTAAGRMIGAAYGLSWGLAQMIDFDFHEIAFAVPLLACSLSALLRGRTRAAVLWALPLVFVKEDQGFTVAALGLVLMLSSVSRRAEPGTDRGQAFRGGLLLICWGIFWSALAIIVIIPHFNIAHVYPYWTDGGAVSPAGHAAPGAVLSQLGASWLVKLRTTLLILLPVGFLALGSPLGLIALPSLAAALRVDQQHVLGRRVPLQRDRDADRVPGRGGRAVPAAPGQPSQALARTWAPAGSRPR